MHNKLHGLYFVVDATIPENRLLPILECALEGGVDIVQMWGSWKNRGEGKAIGEKIVTLTRRLHVPLMIADDIDLCKEIDAGGVHLGGYAIPDLTPQQIKQRLGQDKIVGLTCGSDVEKIRWAGMNGADYISFCSIFPSSSVDTCEIVPLEMIQTAKRILSLPVFASGGITLENISQVLEAGADGVALVSAILKAPDPKRAAEAFKQKLLSFKHA